MQRYEEFAEIIKDKDGKRRYSTLYYPNITPRTSDKYIITKISDRLDLISAREYGDVRYWVIIAKANKLSSPTLRLPVGIRLRIPYPLNHTDVEDAFTNKQF
jgi:nucleoid-associated protein YgaU